MENNRSRRNFIKEVTVVSLLSQVSLTGWAKGFSTLISEGVKPAGEFSLLKLESLLPAYHYPVVTKFSTSFFKSEFALYNLYEKNVVEAGDFLLNADSGDKSPKFSFTSIRLANNGIQDKRKVYKYIVSGEILCIPNVVFSPHKWKISSKISLSGDGEAFMGTGVQNTGLVKDGEIHLNYGEKMIRKSFGTGSLSWKWGLIAVVQKMAEQSISELQFALLDEFDAIYSNQRMKFRRKVILDCGKVGYVDFKIFELKGDGVIPTVYWVDDKNRSVFVISGMEAYVLKA